MTSTGAVLYLVDEGHGGPASSRPRLAEIPVVPGENDGWQRLRLEVDDGRVLGHFGGTYGSTDDGLEVRYPACD